MAKLNPVCYNIRSVTSFDSHKIAGRTVISFRRSIMRPSKLFALVSLTLVFILLATGCGGGKAATQSSSKPAVWEYQPTIAEPVQVTSDKQTVTLADTKNMVSITVPGKSFDKATSLTLKNPTSVPDVMSSEFTPIGAPVEISGAGTRLNNPAVLTFQVDKDKNAADLKDGSIWITYYDGRAWEYFRPATTNVKNGTVTFNTYHFSFFGAGKGQRPTTLC